MVVALGQGQDGVASGRVGQIQKNGAGRRVPNRRRERRVRETMNGHGFTKRKRRQRRGDRDQPHSGDGFHRQCRRWLEKITGEFTENLVFLNFGDRCRELRVAARDVFLDVELAVKENTGIYMPRV
jgi:hypothetical protein